VVTVAARLSGSEVILDVRDTGPGIPDDIMPGIFDPYFTTKEHGTGLGLSEVHRIVTSHGGRISASNASSGGAVLTIRLPEKSA
jgi:signal transduction histidine kinase